MKSATALAVLLALPVSPFLLAADSVPPFVAASVADPARPAADTARDAERKPAESMAFAGVQPKSVVVELMPGGGYYTRLLSKAVGPEGRLYAVVPAPRPDAPPGSPDRSVPIKALAADAGYQNITVQVQPIKALELPSQRRSGLDLEQLSRRAQCSRHRRSGVQQVRVGGTQTRRRLPGH